MDADSAEPSTDVLTVDEISRIAVLGAGNMGHGIAAVAALGGFDVTLRDIDEELVQQGYDQIEWSLGKLTEKGHLSETAAEAALERITPLVDVEAAVGDADVVVEVVPERMDIKRDVYAAVEEYAPDRAIFVTNTSSLSITNLGRGTDRPTRFCGMHFFNPAVRMPLVEVIAGAETAEATLATVEALAERLGKTPVRVRKDSPGFVVNRVLVPLLNEAAWLVHDGEVTYGDVDATAKNGLDLPMGCFELADQVGLDVTLHVLEYLHEQLGDAYEPCPLFEDRVKEGALGRKSGAGFYDYGGGDGDSGGGGDGDGESEREGDAETDDGEGDSGPIPEETTGPNDFDESVRDSLLAVMANEVAKLVDDDVADVEAIDRAMELGAGMAEGPATLADAVGVGRLVDHLDERYAEADADRYEAVDGLRTVAEDSGFSDPAERTGEAYETIRLDTEGRVWELVLDRPNQLNSLDAAFLDEFDRALTEAESDDEARVLLVTGAGDQAFSTGADVQRAAAELGSLGAMELAREGQRVFGRLEASSLVVVAAIDGYCLGGGMELAACADLRIASGRATFGQPEHRLGLMPGWGGTQRLPHLVGEARAKEIILTAERFDAETMADYGFLMDVVDTEELDEKAHELATDLASGPPIAHALTKRAILRGRDDTEAGLELEAQSFGHVFGTDDLREGVAAFDADRSPEFTGE